MSCLDELLLEWEDRRARGEQVDITTLCPDTELRPELAERIRLLEAFDALAACVANPPAAPPLPERIGKYQVTRKLGAGGMGVVYEATDPVLERTVAIKVLKTDSPLAPTGRAVEQFMREVRILGRFARKSIVVAYEAGESDGLPYLVMDYLPNGSLATHQKRLTEAGPAVVAALMEQVARAVQDAHSIGVLHRDLKPSNVLLDEKGVPFIADFGLAAVLATPALPTVPAGSHGSADVITRRGAGTPPYMAPEQFDPSFGPVGTPTDVWALGVMLFELLTGRRPFAPTAMKTLQEQIFGAPVPSMPGVSKALASVVRGCLARRPMDRFQTAGQLADALRVSQSLTRRRVLRVMGLATLAAGGAWWQPWKSGAALAPHSPAVGPDPEIEGYQRPDQIRATLRQMNSGNRADFTNPETSMNYRWGLGPGTGRVFRINGRDRVRANGVCLAELLPHLPPGKWVVEARLKHTKAFMASSEIGMYAAYVRQKTHHVFVHLSLTDRVEAAVVSNTGSRSRLRLWCINDVPDRPLEPRSEIISPSRPLAAPTETGPQVHVLRFVVGESEIGAACNGEHLALVDSHRLTIFVNAIRKSSPAPEGLDFRPLGAIGVFVRDGEASIESFTIRPP